ncbi:unnamed protein product [Adineta steineri]|uniref:Co-chaperone DjlA N-terminal domain-containing protein n=1 Tax=Adineta steineri TaxID=433720 RepID=A0A814XPT5_9BILA|nr:unnamed protein product [Adineta steineri]CAF1335895.1 unnamed protein product [Adineta steineri]
MPRQPAEQVITEWINRDWYQNKDKTLSTNVLEKYMKAILEVAGADGVITDAERKWVLGLAAAHGIGKDEIDALKSYKLGSEDATSIFNNDSKLKTAEHYQNELIYNGLRAAAADGVLKQREIDGISALAKKLGITDEKFQEILAFYKEEEEERQKRIALLFPTKAYGDTIKAIDTHYAK